MTILLVFNRAALTGVLVPVSIAKLVPSQNRAKLDEFLGHRRWPRLAHSWPVANFLRATLKLDAVKMP
jgi:hypothetical protein